MNDFMKGLRKGLPIAIGYLSVSFTFGVKAVHGGIPVWIVILMSATNLTSAGQFAGATLIMVQGSYLEMAVTTFVINIRYMLMSLALSQKIAKDTPLWQRLIAGFGITDEVFAVASTEPSEITSKYLYGLISLPVIGWTAGTTLGAFVSQIMPAALSSAMELGLYAMFIAIIIPPARKSRAVLLVIIIAIVISCILHEVPVLCDISVGFQVIIAAVAAAVVGAVIKPVKEEWRID